MRFQTPQPQPFLLAEKGRSVQQQEVAYLELTMDTTSIPHFKIFRSLIWGFEKVYHRTQTKKVISLMR